ncbi:acetyltransferase [Pandoraea apista]|uniref:PglD-related sugar-binding protein n=1 Tax=Pandoraea apista TaxID=93218 RepID=UPI000CE9ACAA|nr:acetyltransferase [Pandoraea apista]AVF38697.1 acetyltransferase [Pandoraea apista]
MSRILLIGGGGFAKEVHEIAELSAFQVIGHLADTPGIVKVPYLGQIEQVGQLRDKFDFLVIAFAAVDRKSIARRSALIARLEALSFRFASLISPHAVVSRGAEIGPGSIVAHGVVLSVDTIIGAHVVLNTSAIVGHDAVVADRTIIAPGAFIGGAASIGADCLIGPNSTVLQARSVGDNAIVSLGGIVKRNLDSGMTILPNSSKALK